MPAAAAPNPSTVEFVQSGNQTRHSTRSVGRAGRGPVGRALARRTACVRTTREGRHGARTERLAPPPSPRCLRRGAPQRPTQGPLPRRDQGLRPHGRAQPLLGRRPLRTPPLGRPLPRGHGPRDDHEGPPGHLCPPLLNARFSDITRHYGIPITTPARTLIDLAASFEYRALRRTVRQAQSRLTNVPQILNALDRLGPRRGTANLTKILATGPAPTRSEPRGHRARPDPRRRLPAPRGQPATHDQRPPRHPRLPVANPAAWSSRPTAPNGTTTPSPARTTPSAKPSSRPTASASSASRGSRRSPAGRDAQAHPRRRSARLTEDLPSVWQSMPAKRVDPSVRPHTSAANIQRRRTHATQGLSAARRRPRGARTCRSGSGIRLHGCEEAPRAGAVGVVDINTGEFTPTKNNPGTEEKPHGGFVELTDGETVNTSTFLHAPQGVMPPVREGGSQANCMTARGSTRSSSASATSAHRAATRARRPRPARPARF